MATAQRPDAEREQPPRRDPWPRRRALAVLGAFALGLSGAALTPAAGPGFRAGPASPAWFALAAGLAALATALHGLPRVTRAALLAATIACGAGWWTLRVDEAPRADAAALLPGPVAWHGLVASLPRPDPGVRNPLLSGRGSGPTTRFRLAVLAAETPAGVVPLAGSVDVLVRAEVRDLRTGDAVRVRGILAPVDGPRNPGERDRRPTARLDGRLGQIEAEQAGLVTPSDRPLGSAGRLRQIGLWGVGVLRARAARALDAVLLIDPIEANRPAHGVALDDTAEGRAMLAALLLGREDRGLAPVTDAFGRLGLVHVLSISGFHLVVMAGVATALLRITGDRGALEPLLVAAAVAVYLLIVPAEAPVLRSGAMVFVLLLAEATGRRYDRVSVLAYIALALLLLRPVDAFSPGFQLSFGVTGALLWLGGAWQQRLLAPGVLGAPDPVALDPANWPLRRRARHFAAGLLATSVLAWAISTPLVMHHAGILSPLAWLTSMVLVPVFVALLWLGFAALALGVIAPALGALLGWPLGWLADATLALVRVLDGSACMALRVPTLPVAWTLTATAVLAVGLAGLGWRRATWWWLLAGVLGWLALILARVPALPAGVALRADTLAVGPGAATLLRSGGETIAWSLGSRWRGTLRAVAPQAARALGVWRVRAVIVPSTDEADFTGLADAAAFLEVRDVFVPRGFLALAADRADGAHADLLARLAGRGVSVRVIGAGDEIRFGTAALRVLQPDAARPQLAGVVDDRLLLAHALPAETARTLVESSRGVGVAMLPAAVAPASVATWLTSGRLQAAWRSTAPARWGEEPRDPVPGFSDTGVDGAVSVEIDAAGRTSVRRWRE